MEIFVPFILAERQVAAIAVQKSAWFTLELKLEGGKSSAHRTTVALFLFRPWSFDLQKLHNHYKLYFLWAKSIPKPLQAWSTHKQFSRLYSNKPAPSSPRRLFLLSMHCVTNCNPFKMISSWKTLTNTLLSPLWLVWMQTEMLIHLYLIVCWSLISQKCCPYWRW